MEYISVEYFPSSFDPGNNEKKVELHSYIIDDNEQDTFYSNNHIFHLLKKS